MRSHFLFSFYFLLFPLLLNAQNADKGVHRFAVRGDIQGVSASQSDLFRQRMNGVFGGELSLQYPFTSSFYAAIGGNLSAFESNKQGSNLLAEETKMHAYGPYVKVGVNPYVGRIFYVEASVKASYRWLEFNSPLCNEKGRKTYHGQKGTSVEPRIGFWWDAGDGMDFGAIVGREWVFDRFHPDLVCEKLSADHAKKDEYYGFWHFGFAFSADLVRNR